MQEKDNRTGSIFHRDQPALTFPGPAHMVVACTVLVTDPNVHLITSVLIVVVVEVSGELTIFLKLAWMSCSTPTMPAESPRPYPRMRY